MHAILDPEVRRFRAKAALVQSAVLLGVVASLFAIGATAPERQFMTMNCAVDASATGTVSDAMLELSSICPGAAQAAAEPAATDAKFGVPDAKASLDPRAQPEVQPPTF
jgi:hypothetical protein